MAEDSPTDRFVEFGLLPRNMQVRVPEAKSYFPYFQDRNDNGDDQESETLSVADRAFWYLKNDIPCVFNGQTGIGKTVTAESLAHVLQYHLEEDTASDGHKKNDFLVIPTQEEGSGRYITLPGPLALAELVGIMVDCGGARSDKHGQVPQGSIFFLDEAANLPKRTATSLNKIIQARADGFHTHMGRVNLNWDHYNFILSGNYHDPCPNYNAPFRYRFIWLEFDEPSDDASRAISRYKQQCEEKDGSTGPDDPDIPDQYKIRRLERYDRSPALNDLLTNMGTELYKTLSRYGRNHRNFSANGHSKTKETLERLGYAWHNRKPAGGIYRSFKEEFISGREVDPNMNLADRYFQGPAWRAAPEISHEVTARIKDLYHPSMTRADFRNVLHDILLHPATGLEPVPFNPAVQNFVNGQKAIINEILLNYGENLKRAQP